MRLLRAGAAVGPRRQWRRIDQAGAPASPLAEAFAALRTAVLLGDDNSAPRVVLVTSAQSAEGKTTVSVNLALSLSRLNHRVLLIDANMRFPCIHEALGVGPVEGLSEYLASNRDWRQFVRPATDQNLDVLACGEPAASPADVLSLPRMRQLVADASREYDFVIMDSPALLANPADVRSLASMADNVLLTVRQGWTPREAVSVALSQLSRVSGVVLNRSDFHDVPAYQRDISVQPSV
jgi:capsular exopolysaccharide synthesis family protein